MLIPKRLQRGALLLLCVLCSSALLRAQLAAPKPEMPGSATLEFKLERPGLAVPSYAFLVHEDGSGTYAATHPATYLEQPVDPSAPRDASSPTAPAPRVTRPLAISPHTTAKLFSLARSTHGFHTPCASKAKNIADTGTKTLSYNEPGGTSSCTFNYTEVKPVAELIAIFQGMALTLDIAHKLDFKHRFDRLGLDEEMKSLVDSARTGRALEMSNIAPSLQALVDDPAVLERVRTAAAALLAQGAAGLAQGTAGLEQGTARLEQGSAGR